MLVVYIILNTNRKVGILVKMQGQPFSYDTPFTRYDIHHFSAIYTKNSHFQPFLLILGVYIIWNTDRKVHV